MATIRQAAHRHKASKTRFPQLAIVRKTEPQHFSGEHNSATNAPLASISQTRYLPTVSISQREYPTIVSITQQGHPPTVTTRQSGYTPTVSITQSGYHPTVSIRRLTNPV